MQRQHAKSSRVRFVFDDMVLSVDRSAEVTFGEIARTLDELSRRRDGHPVAIAVTLMSGERAVARQMLCVDVGISRPWSA